jgi:ligand-binding sensor domain-containing protein/two-component sensor histidine kinase
LVSAIGEAISVQAQTLSFRTYSIEQGLSGSVAHEVLQDQEGYVWIATNYGVSRFDGIEFKNYGQQSGLNSKKIFSLYEDQKGIIWAGTDHGINLIDGDSIKTPAYFNRLSRSSVSNIEEDQAGGVWIGTDGDGAWHWKSDNGLKQWTTEDGLGSSRVRDVIVDPHTETIWIATDEGVSYRKTNQERFTTLTTAEGLPGNKIRDLYLAGSDSLYIATRDGLALWNGRDFMVRTSQHGLINDRIQSIAADELGGLWLGTEEGVSYYYADSFRNYAIDQGLTTEYVQHVMIDEQGHIWFATYGGGVSYFLNNNIQSFSTDHGLPSNMISGFAEIPDQGVWVATYGGGVAQYQEGKIVDILNKQSGLVDDKVYTVYGDSQNRLWIGTRWGFSIYQNNGFINFDTSELRHRKVRSILEDTVRNTFWLGTDGNGLIRYYNQQFTYIDTTYGLISSTIYDMELDNRGDLWVATDKGVSRFDGSVFQNYTIEQGLPSNGVLDIHKDFMGHMWFATYGGVAVLDGQRFHSITERLPSRVNYFIVSDDEGTYWVGTNQGVIKLKFDATQLTQRIRAHDFQVQLLTHEQGLIANETNVGAGLYDQDKNFWFGTVGGLSKMKASDNHKQTHAPRIHIQKISVFNQTWLYEQVKRLELSSNENYVEISFTGLDFSAPHQLRFAYRLKNVNEEWQYTNERSVSFSALSPDNYTFEVKAQNADGVWSTKTASIQFTILAPFWQRWWFSVLVGLLVLSIIYFIYRYYSMRKIVDIERMRVQIASDLHDDVGGSLTEIALQTDLLRTHDLQEEMKETLKQIGQQSRHVVSSLDDIVWSIDARNDSFGDLTDRMQDYVNNLFRNRDIQVVYHLDELDMGASLPVEIRENIYLIFKEAVNNVAKHSDATVLEIGLQTNKNSYQLAIRDNGNSQQNGRKTGQGLTNMKMRARRIDANLTLKNKQGFTVEVTGSL